MVLSQRIVAVIVPVYLDLFCANHDLMHVEHVLWWSYLSRFPNATISPPSLTVGNLGTSGHARFLRWRGHIGTGHRTFLATAGCRVEQRKVGFYGNKWAGKSRTTLGWQLTHTTSTTYTWIIVLRLIKLSDTTSEYATSTRTRGLPSGLIVHILLQFRVFLLFAGLLCCKDRRDIGAAAAYVK